MSLQCSYPQSVRLLWPLPLTFCDVYPKVGQLDLHNFITHSWIFSKSSRSLCNQCGVIVRLHETCMCECIIGVKAHYFSGLCCTLVLRKYWGSNTSCCKKKAVHSDFPENLSHSNHNRCNNVCSFSPSGWLILSELRSALLHIGHVLQISFPQQPCTNIQNAMALCFMLLP